MMAVAGATLYMFFVWLSLKEWGQIVGGSELKEQIGRATKLGILAYITIFLVILLAGFFNPEGITGLPAVAALLLALGGMSPLLWMMQWFRAICFDKVTKAPLEIQRQWVWVITAVAAVFVYAIVLGRTLYF
jgi:hypothetical protein